MITVFAYWMIYCAFLVGAAWLLAQAALRSWGRPERLDASWSWTRPAPCRSDRPLGPLRPRDASDDMRYRISPRGDGYWHAEPDGAGATEDWSPAAEHAAAERGRLPLDDVDEWLAVRLSSYDHALSRIDAGAGAACGAELARFQRGSIALHAYRSMILDSTGGYGPREAMQLEELLAA